MAASRQVTVVDDGQAATVEDEQPKFTMRVDLAVIESLGINLYSNAAAVLSELVANAYDADANSVSINWNVDDDEVVVIDDGVGMTLNEINGRFLTVGYKKREVEGGTSDKFERPFMGRKGIGKLSVFSIARTVQVYTTKDGEVNGLEIEVDELERRIKAQEEYHPKEIDVPTEYAAEGTTLVLSQLKPKRAGITVNALRKRLARRFDVLDETSPEDGGFDIEVNGKTITWADREDLKKLEFIWEFGQEHLPDSALPKGVRRFVLKTDTAGRPDWKVTGWIGTAKEPTDLVKDEEAGSLKNVIVLARKRPIQEGIIDKLDFSKLFGNYVTGQIEADFLDLDGDYDDIATSDRQRLIEDDERVIALRDLLRSSFIKAAETWGEERPKQKGKDILERYPKLKEWVEGRPPWQQQPAYKMISTIAGLTLEETDEANDRTDLLKHGVLAFERVGLRKTSEELDDLSDLTAENLLALLGRQDIYEEALWGEILKSRVEAIERFRGLTDADEKEKVLQGHLFKNLWLLDPGWERATGSEEMEQYLHKIEPGLFPEHPDGTQIKGRLDIRYATLSGRHVIVELKKYGRSLQAEELAKQGLKYYTALSSVLEKRNARSRDIEVVFVLGKKPGAQNKGTWTDEKFYESQFGRFHGRFVLYDELIANAQNQYEAYLKKSAQVQDLTALLDSLDESEDDSATAAPKVTARKADAKKKKPAKARARGNSSGRPTRRKKSR